MKRFLRIIGPGAFLVLLLAGCSLFGGLTTDVIVGSWQQASVNGNDTVTVNLVTFTADSYTTTVAGVTTNTGTWTKSGGTYTLNGAFFGFLATTSTFTPAFTNSRNTMTYTDESGYVEVYNRK